MSILIRPVPICPGATRPIPRPRHLITKRGSRVQAVSRCSFWGSEETGISASTSPSRHWLRPPGSKTLTESTRRANQVYFGLGEAPPGFAITMEVGTILSARECLLLATGAEKATAVAAMIEGPVSAICPASALQMRAPATN